MTQNEIIEKLKNVLHDIYDIAERAADCDETPDGHKQPNDWMLVQMLVDNALDLVGRKN